MLHPKGTTLQRLVPFGWSTPTQLGLVLFFSNLYFYIPVGTLYLQGKGLNYLQINSLWGIIVGSSFLAEVPTGMLADRWGRARAVQMALFLQLIGEIIFLFAHDYLLFATAAVAGGIGFAFSSGSAEAMVYDDLLRQGRESEMSRAMGFVAAAMRLANLLAFALAALLVAELSSERFRLAIAVTAAMVFVGWLFSFTLVDDGVREETGGDGSLDMVRVGLASLRGTPALRRLVLLSLTTIPFVDYLLNLYQPHFVEVGVPSAWLGLGLAFASLLSILAARYAYVLESHLGARGSLLLSTLLPGLLYLLFAAVQRPAAAIAVFCLLYSSISIKAPLFSGHMNRQIASRYRATLLSLINMASALYVALMGLLIGSVADVSLSYAFVLMGCIVIAGSLLFRID